MDRASTYAITRSRSASPTQKPQKDPQYTDREVRTHLREIFANSMRARAFFASRDRADKFDMLLSENGINTMNFDQESDVVHFYLRNEVYLSASKVLFFNGRDVDGKSMLDRAIEQNNILMVQYLFMMGVMFTTLDKPEGPDEWGWSGDGPPVITATTDTVRSLIDRMPNFELLDLAFTGWDGGRLINARDRAGETPLTRACSRNDARQADLLLRISSVDPNKSNATGLSPLIIAVKNGNLALVERLMERVDVDPDLANKKGQSARNFLNKRFPNHSKVAFALDRRNEIARVKSALRSLQSGPAQWPCDAIPDDSGRGFSGPRDYTDHLIREAKDRLDLLKSGGYPEFEPDPEPSRRRQSDSDSDSGDHREHLHNYETFAFGRRPGKYDLGNQD
jgi:hypothetical protein